MWVRRHGICGVAPEFRVSISAFIIHTVISFTITCQ